MELSRRSRLPPLIVFIIIVCVQTSQARFYGERQKRQNGANMYLPASSIIPGGEGNDPNEWAEWSSPSECSRSCGGGVSFQTRECLRRRSDGSPACNGGESRYFSCNTQDCPEEEPDFRTQQCSRFNHVPFDGIHYEWVPYTNAPNPCELNCMPKGERFYYRHKAKVIDGTRCNDQDLNVCVNGQCQPVGCDMMLGSGAKEDSCRKCGGDGTTCRTLSDRFTTNNLASGYNDLLLIPSGATNIRVQETAPSNNYLSCRNLSSHYYLNGNWRIDFPRPMLFAGSWWTYQRKPTGFAAPDQLTCRGPITESIVIVMLVQDKNASIEYEYSIPQSESSQTPVVYTWTHMEYGPCSTSCGGGNQTRTVTCNNRLNLDEVDPSFCDEKTKPAESQECGTEPCAPHWATTDWGKCSKGCGSDGTQNRTVQCERISPSGENNVEDDAVCLQQVGNKPANQQECNRDVKNCPKYHLGPWSPCDKLCGEGKQNRKVTCYIEENGRKKVLSDEDCVEEKPETETTCMLAPCEGVDWIISQWSGCDACGQTTETRTAVCGSKSGKVYPDEFCAPEVPLVSRSCKSKKCKTQWFTSEWSKCSSPCGKGHQSRVVLCGEFDGKTVAKVTDESQCDASTKPVGSQECEGEEKECPGQWFSGPWGSCSKPCGGGERQREVLCLSNGTISSNCDGAKIESLSEKCNTQACTEDEVLPLGSSDKPISDDDAEDCEEEDDEDNKLVTDKMSADLKIGDGIDLDEDTTLSSLMTDDLMMSDSTPPTDGASSESTRTTIEGSGDETESTDMSSIGEEGSGDMETTTQAINTGITTSEPESTVSSDVTGSTSSYSTISGPTDASASTEVTGSTVSSASTESSGSTDDSSSVSADSSISTSDTGSTDSISTDITGTTQGTSATEYSSASTVSSSTDTSAGTGTASVTTDSSATTVSSNADETTESSASAVTETGTSSAITDSSATTVSSSTDPSATTVTGTASMTTDSSGTTVSSSVDSSTESTASVVTGTGTSSAITDSSASTVSPNADATTESSASAVTGTGTSSALTDSSATTVSSSAGVTADPSDTTGTGTTSETTDSSGTTVSSSEDTTIDSSASTVTDTGTSSSIADSSATTVSSSTDTTTESTGSTSTDTTSATSDSSATTASSSTDTTTESTASTSTDTTSATTDSSETTVSSSTDTSTDSTASTGTGTTSDITDSSATTVSSSEDTTVDSSASTVTGTTSDITDSSATTVSSSDDITADSSASTVTGTTSDITDSSATTVSSSADSSASTVTDITSATEDSSATTVSSSSDTTMDSSASTGTGTTSATEDSSVTTVSSSADTTVDSSASTVTDTTPVTSDSSATTVSSSADTSTESTASTGTDTTSDTTDSSATTVSSSEDATVDSSASTGTGTTSATEDSSATTVSSSADTSADSSASAVTGTDSVTTDSSATTASGDTTMESSASTGKSTSDSASASTVSSSDTTTDSITDTTPGSSITTQSTDTSSSSTIASGTTDASTGASGTTDASITTDDSSSTDGLSTTSNLFDSTTESSGDTSLSTDEFTTVDIWTTEDEDFEKSTPNTLEAAITKESKLKKCKGKKPKGCKKTEHGCCPDGKTVAKGPFDEGCPIPKTCEETEFGCCPDGVSPAGDSNFTGCPKSQCAETLFGCCPDKYTPAEGDDNEGCPEPTTTLPPFTTTESSDEETTMGGESTEGQSTESSSTEGQTTEEQSTVWQSTDSTEMPQSTESPVPLGAVQSCSFSEFGCCPDGSTVATGKDFAGCNVAVAPADCRQSQFGCCRDGRTPASGPDNEGCPSCTAEQFGCCPDNETPAHGPLGEGCCLNSPYGCCPDNINSARGPNFEDCDCQYAPYGCCPDNKTAARGPSNEGCGCEDSQFGCCPDKLTTAQGPKFEGCACYSLQFGCCPDGVTAAQGPHHYGCHCSQTEHKCCPDEKTAAKGPNFEGCTCLESKFGCCPDGVTSAQGNKFEGCENVKEPPQKACGLPKATGTCGNYTIKYFFDTNYGACAKFWYAGCEGNGNRFETENDCKETCQDYTGKDVCFLPKSSGPCTGHTSKWYFDADRGSCEEFKYGGCLGTNNRFDTKEECQSLCTVSETTPPCDQPMDEGPCEGNFERWFYDNHTDVCRPFRYGGCKGNKNNYATESACNYQCRQPGVHKEYCSLPKKTGDCSEKQPRWHYAEADKKCMPFYYTGCGGNKNNFPTLDSCQDHCPKEVVKDVCEIAAEVGDCTNYEAMWYYDTKDQKCRQFYYGGCGGNENKFATEESCLQRCEKIPDPEPQPQPQPEPEAQPQPQPEQPAASTNVCDEQPEQGPCANYTLLWHYDKGDGACKQFYYGGCDGNGNRFNSKEECAHQCIREAPRQPEQPQQPQQPEQPQVQGPEDRPPTQNADGDVCLLAQDMGDCDDYVAMWYFDSKESRCSMFYYGGCGGNGNRFASEDECNRRCLLDNEPVDIGIHSGEAEPDVDVEASTEVDSSRKCYLPAASGNCLENQARWYYNSADGVCDQFLYTGCGGNANNYATESECEDECFAVHNTCQLPALRGNCNETVIRWHYSEAEGRCNEFEFTGCRGNRNNFVTERECLTRCGSGEPPAYSVCDLPLETGECENSTTAWHYDNEAGQCVAFIYTGCGGNGNRFQSKEQCERQCGEFKSVDVCNEDVASGPCRQWQTRYYFNKRSRTCEPFTYGGCEGTGNRFENRAECESLCIIGQEPKYTDTKDLCKQRVDVGRCNNVSITERRWYYDDSRGNCVTFIYSGCAGNQNNFRSYESCYNYCAKPEITNNEVLPTSRCEELENECRSMSCPYGVRRVAVDEECQRCECDNPCAEHACPEGEQCAIEVSNERSGEFEPVCRLINKAGTCPQLTASDGACARECYTDADCREDNKCCSNGCGFVCVHPAVPTIRTTAPTTPAPVVVYPGEVKVSLTPKQKPELDVQTPVGGIAVLRCFATGNPVPNVTWSRSNVMVDTNQGRYVLTSSGDLTIVQVRQTDSGSYVCVASNGLGEPVRREVELKITDPVNLPAYVYGDKNVTQIVTLNRPAVVRCPAGGHPTPMVHWWRNRSRLPLVSNRFELARDYSLTFRSVQLSDLGPYTCEAWNRLSVRPSSIKVTLVAVGPARATTNEDAQYLQYIVEPPRAPVTQRPSSPFRPTRPPAVPPPHVVEHSLPAVPVNAVIGKDPSNNYAPGSTVVLGCSIHGYPMPNVTWIKDGLPLVPSERVQISVGAPYRVIINNVSTADSGRYGCKAANAVSYSISEEMINIESTIPLNPDCIDNVHYANCNLIVRGRYCKHTYYAKFCCRSCALAGQL